MAEDADDGSEPSDRVGTESDGEDGSSADPESEGSPDPPGAAPDGERSDDSGEEDSGDSAPAESPDPLASTEDAVTASEPEASEEPSESAEHPGTASELADTVGAVGRSDAAESSDAELETLGPDEPDPAPRGPASDQEMPLEDHIEEMIYRLATVVLAAAIVSAIMLPFGDSMITFLWDSILVGTDARPHLYSPPELIITQVKVASLAGLVAALPVLVYQSYRFMRPGLYPHERRYYLAAVPTSLILAFVGLTFAYFVVLPAVFTYFLRYSEETATIAFGLAPTFNLILILMGYLAVVFQIPLFVMLAMMMGLVTRRWLIQRRLLFWGAFAGISFLFSPDPTGISPIIIALTMVVLFEGTLFLARWTKTGQRESTG